MNGPAELREPPVLDAPLHPARTAEEGGVRGLIRRRPLTSFFVLSCVLAWWPAVLYAVGAFPQPIAGFGPFLAALAVLGVTRGRTGVRALLRSMVTWRVPGRAYLLAVGLPVLLSGIAPISANLALGAQPSAEALAAWSAVPLTFLVVLLVPGLAGAWEEPGFRGYALSRLEAKYGAITGPLVLGLLWVVWHGPLFLIGEILWTDVFVVMAASVVIAFVFHAGRESVLVAMIFHAFNNAVGGQYASQIFHGADHTRQGMLTALAWWLVAGAILVVVRNRSRLKVDGDADAVRS